MATYLKFHQLKRSPFEGRDSHQLVLATASLRSAYAEIKVGLQENAPRICVSGGAGIGKSSFARALPKLLESDARCVLVRDPSSAWSQLETSVAKQLQLKGGQLARTSLLPIRQQGRRIVLIIDQAEELPPESLEHLDRLLGYRDDEGEPLVQCILLANLEQAPRGREIPLLWWLDQLATRQLRFSPIPEEGIRSYIDKHLKKAGSRDTSIFIDSAVTAIYRYTGGVPRAVSALCEELLTRAAELRQHQIDAELVASICRDELPAGPDAKPNPPEADLPSLFQEPACDPTAVKLETAPSPPLHDRRAIRLDAPDPFAAPEPELQIQQGLVHMEEPEAGTAYSGPSGLSDDDSFSSFQPTRSDPRRRKELHRGVSPLAPGSGRGARIVRNLMGAALLLCMAMAIHMFFFAEEPAAPRLRKPLPAPKALVQPAPPELAVGGPSFVLEPRPEAQTLAVVTEAASAANLEFQTPDGLTADLRLDPTTGPLAATAGPLVEQPEALAAADDLSLGELQARADESPDEPRDFEPWAEQAPEPAATLNPTAAAPQP
jgi:type II secretory pathway predicted ATPase ExeA